MLPLKLLAPSLVVSFLALPAPAAHAAESGSTNAPNGVLFECADHEYTYSIDLPSEADGWSADITVRGPDGLEATSDFIYDAPTHGTSEFQLCSFDEPGRYTITGEVEWHDYDYNTYTFSLRSSSFTMRAPRTRTSLTASATRVRRGAVVRFQITSKEERPAGYYPNEYDTVVLQRFVNGTWERIPGARGFTNERGRDVLKGRMTSAKAKVRALTPGEDGQSSSASRPIVLRAR